MGGIGLSNNSNRPETAGGQPQPQTSTLRMGASSRSTDLLSHLHRVVPEKLTMGFVGSAWLRGLRANRCLFGIQPKELSTIFDPPKVSAASEFIVTDRLSCSHCGLLSGPLHFLSFAHVKGTAESLRRGVLSLNCSQPGLWGAMVRVCGCCYIPAVSGWLLCLTVLLGWFLAKCLHCILFPPPKPWHKPFRGF